MKGKIVVIEHVAEVAPDCTISVSVGGVDEVGMDLADVDTLIEERELWTGASGQFALTRIVIT